MFFSRNKKNNVYPYKPQFYYIKVGFKGFKIIQVCFRDGYEKPIFFPAEDTCLLCIFLIYILMLRLKRMFILSFIKGYQRT